MLHMSSNQPKEAVGYLEHLLRIQKAHGMGEDKIATFRCLMICYRLLKVPERCFANARDLETATK